MITRTAIKGNLKLLQQVLLGNSTPLGATCYTFFSFQLIGFYTKATEGFPRLETAIVKCNLARSNFIWFHSCQLTHCAKPTIFVFWRQFQFRISGLKWPPWPQRPPWPWLTFLSCCGFTKGSGGKNFFLWGKKGCCCTKFFLGCLRQELWASELEVEKRLVKRLIPKRIQRWWC